MEKRTAGIAALVLTIILCGCPGLIGLCFGAISVPVSFIPGAEIDIFGSNDPNSAMMLGLAALCVGLIAIAIPIIVAIVTFRRPKTPVVPPPPSFNEPIPPAI